MTVTYSLDVASSTFCGIHKLLFRWKGSIWKSIWPELLLWLTAYAGLSFLYRFVLSKEHQRLFEDLAVFFYTYGDYIPLTFMLGFYVTAVFGRWNSIFDNLGWIDSSGLLLTVYIRGHDEVARKIRRTIMRYLVLVQAMVYRDISTSVKKRFPTMDHLVTSGLMTTNELKEFDSIVSPQLKYWVPMNWVFLLVRKARDLGLIDSDIIYTDLLEKIRQYRVNVLNLTLYDWVPVPLVYTQVVNLAVRTYFLVALLGRQYLVTDRDIPTAKTIDLYFPIMTVFQFLFYIGWMKVAEVLLNPLGDDDDDFECNWVIDRNLQVGLAMVDEACGRVPELEKDIFWNEILPEPLYTQESANRPHNPMIGSCNDLSGEDALFLQPPKHRFMSPSTIDPSEYPQTIIPGEVLVKRHNPKRRSYSMHSDSGRSSAQLYDRNKFLASFKRKINQRKSLVGDYGFSESYDWNPETGFGNRVPRIDISRPDSENRWNTISRNNSITSSSFLDGIQVPFAQSLPPYIPWTRRASEPLDLNTDLRIDENQDIQRPNSTNWTVNEMLPVIQEEENEKSRKSTMIGERGEFSKMNNQKDEKSGQKPLSSLGESTDSLERLKRILKAADSVSSDSSNTLITEEDSRYLEKLKEILKTADSISSDSSNTPTSEESKDHLKKIKETLKTADSVSSTSTIVANEEENDLEKQKQVFDATISTSSSFSSDAIPIEESNLLERKKEVSEETHSASSGPSGGVPEKPSDSTKRQNLKRADSISLHSSNNEIPEDSDNSEKK